MKLYNTRSFLHFQTQTYLKYSKVLCEKMAYKASSFLALVLIANVLLSNTCQARNSIPKNSNTDDKKEPQWFFHFDGIPGFGRVGLPPLFGSTPQSPSNGGGGGEGAGSGSAPGGYVPGGDDTFVPNPGNEVPIPGSAGAVPVPAAVHP
ncbi:putative cell wall protein [Vicia villosa]|uniref:putative cell wall protein n=1 Tax=Vicia villosa TaxID=3911 RepID=UPI00273B689E|nr:putative cell wall protein [Vicia villosa]